MPKRSAQDKIERYEKKIRKIEEKHLRRRVITPIISSSEDEDNENAVQATDNEGILPVPTGPDAIHDASLEPTDALPQNEGVAGPSLHEENSTVTDPDLVVDPELLLALGETMSDTPDYGEKIHDNLTKLWLPLLRKGMTKEDKDKVIKDYLIPENCRLLQAPKLNAEISAAVPDSVRNRDKILATSQQQLGAGITAINRGIDTLLRTDNKIQAMKHLSNGCRILCDSHHAATQHRVKCITPSLDKSVLHMINESERDETLFGSSLSDKIKAAKAIEKQGLQIKKPYKAPRPAVPQLSTRPATSYQGNWSAPPRFPSNRGGRGAYRKPTPQGARRPYMAPAQQAPTPRASYQDKPRAPPPTRH